MTRVEVEVLVGDELEQHDEKTDETQAFDRVAVMLALGSGVASATDPRVAGAAALFSVDAEVMANAVRSMSTYIEARFEALTRNELPVAAVRR
jgi:hypothetical protein